MKQYYVYILAAKKNGTLYIGFTSNLIKRVYEHKNDLVEGFSSEHRVHSLVYYEIFEDVYEAIKREKNLKAWKRQWKVNLIEKENPNWIDFYESLL